MGSNRFERKSEQELAAMSEDDLLAYLQDARRAGAIAATAEAVAMLVWGFMDTVERRVALKVPEHAVEEVAKAAMLSALTSDFDGSSVGEFRRWIGRIVQRRIADYHRDPKRDVRLDPLPTEHLGDDEVWGDEPAVQFEGDAVDAERAIAQAFGELNPEHQAVVDLYIFADLSAGDVAKRTGLTEANVHKIAQRFRDRVDELFPGDGDTPT